MLLVGVLLFVALGLMPSSAEGYQAIAKAGGIFADTSAKSGLHGICGDINGVKKDCDPSLACSKGRCKTKVGQECKATNDCEYGTLCTNFNAGGRTFNLCLKPQ
jgi:hypothetical protein